MSLSRHCVRYAQDIEKAYSDNYMRKDRDFVAKVLYKSVQSWMKKMGGNREDYPRIQGGLLGYDAESVAVLIQSNMDLKHVFEDKIPREAEHEWCFMDDGSGTIRAVLKQDILLPYWTSFSFPAQARKGFYDKNPEQLLGNAVFHPAAVPSIDTVASPGSVIGPFVWISPGVAIGILCSIKAHTSIASDVTIGNYTSIEQNVSIGQGVRIGEGVTIGQGAVICRDVKINSGTVIHPGQIVKMDCGFRNPLLNK